MPATVTLHDQFVEVVFSGEVERGRRLTDEGIEHARRTQRILFDFSEITRAAFDPMQLGDGMTRLANQGVRLAICSTNPVYFGFGRQISLYSGVEGTAIAVFKHREDAVNWLLRDILPNEG